MHIHVNGESRDVANGTTVTGLLQELQLTVEKVAVEINLEILDKQDFDRRLLNEGDRIEIMSFIGGGAVCGRRKAWTSVDLRVGDMEREHG